mgnify:CR=1 FL=1
MKQEREVIYYAGVYEESEIRVKKGRVCQVSDIVDGLSCKILAEPGVVYMTFFSVKDMLIWARAKAEEWTCTHLEINCAIEQGSYHQTG